MNKAAYAGLLLTIIITWIVLVAQMQRIDWLEARMTNAEGQNYEQGMALDALRNRE